MRLPTLKELLPAIFDGRIAEAPPTVCRPSVLLSGVSFDMKEPRRSGAKLRVSTRGAGLPVRRRYGRRRSSDRCSLSGGACRGIRIAGYRALIPTDGRQSGDENNRRAKARIPRRRDCLACVAADFGYHRDRRS
jgi:hypothetical protein